MNIKSNIVNIVPVPCRRTCTDSAQQRKNERPSHLFPTILADPLAPRKEIADSRRVYKETVVVDDGVIIVGVLTGEFDPHPCREVASSFRPILEKVAGT